MTQPRAKLKKAPIDECFNFSEEEIARLCGVSVATARRWRRGVTQPSQSARMILAADLGCFDPAWRGWTIRRGKLISREGWEATPGEVLAIPLMHGKISAYQAWARAVHAIDEQPPPGDIPTIVE